MDATKLPVPAFALSILSLVLVFLLPRWPIVALLCGILGIVFTVMARKAGKKNGLTTAALILGIIGIIISGVWFIAVTLLRSMILNIFGGLFRSILSL